MRHWSAALILVLTVGIGQALAQDAPAASSRESGGWLGVGGGYVAFRSDCSNCEGEDLYSGGAGWLVSGGWSVNSRMDVGGEVFTNATTRNYSTYRTTYVLGVARFRPWDRHGFFLTAGFGIVYFKGAFSVGGFSNSVTDKGLGVHYGAGWIFGQGRRVSVAPFGAHYVSTLGDVQLPLRVAENAVSNAWVAGVTLLIR